MRIFNLLTWKSSHHIQDWKTSSPLPSAPDSTHSRFQKMLGVHNLISIQERLFPRFEFATKHSTSEHSTVLTIAVSTTFIFKTTCMQKHKLNLKSMEWNISSIEN